MRSTTAVRRIAAALLAYDARGERVWGWPLHRVARVRAASMYRVLDRMLEEGWVTDGWESVPTRNGYPPRRYYTLTVFGRDMCRAAINTPDREEVAS